MIHAYINEGRWIAECPKCRWALHVDRAFTRFVCGRMSNGDMSPGGCGYSSSVQFPGDADGIEAVLKVRPRENKHWLPSETLADLRIENAVHGLPSGLEVK